MVTVHQVAQVIPQQPLDKYLTCTIQHAPQPRPQVLAPPQPQEPQVVGADGHTSTEALPFQPQKPLLTVPLDQAPVQPPQ